MALWTDIAVLAYSISGKHFKVNIPEALHNVIFTRNVVYEFMNATDSCKEFRVWVY